MYQGEWRFDSYSHASSNPRNGHFITSGVTILVGRWMRIRLDKSNQVLVHFIRGGSRILYFSFCSVTFRAAENQSSRRLPGFWSFRQRWIRRYTRLLEPWSWRTRKMLHSRALPDKLAAELQSYVIFTYRISLRSFFFLFQFSTRKAILTIYRLHLFGYCPVYTHSHVALNSSLCSGRC